LAIIVISVLVCCAICCYCRRRKRNKTNVYKVEKDTLPRNRGKRDCLARCMLSVHK